MIKRKYNLKDKLIGSKEEFEMLQKIQDELIYIQRLIKVSDLKTKQVLYRERKAVGDLKAELLQKMYNKESEFYNSEIADIYGMSRQRVDQLYKMAMNKLKKNKLLKEYSET